MPESYQTRLNTLHRIEGRRIILREFTLADAEDVLEYGRDSEVTRFLTWESFYDLDHAKAVIKGYYQSRKGIFAIELKSEKKCIGCIDLRLHIEHHKASFGYVLNRTYWGTGYMSEALELILALAFVRLGLNRVESTHYVGNEASGRVMTKCGMRYEGIGYKEQFIRGQFVDVVHYGITKEEYKK